MPRIARIIVPDYPHHITQRGNNRSVVFFDDDDRRMYLKLLTIYTRKHSVQILAYCLMDNHIHLLAIPKTETALARGIGLTNLVYTQYLNRKRGQSGRIWQNRFFSCVVENDRHLWTVARYIECNPLKAGRAEIPEAYFWSSAKAHLTGADDSVLSPNPWFDPAERTAYARFVRIDQAETEDAIRKATRTGRPFGSESFVEMLEFRMNRSLMPKRAGRRAKK
jgi:putative transposase